VLQVGVKFYVCDLLARKTYDFKYLTVNLLPFSLGVTLGLLHRGRNEAMAVRGYGADENI
jgi:hypothetical protein